ncbi:type II toxin-antitoxin system VapC family toxin [Immundisolibacter sp.]|uniref:type II toxin-antitoxin system VapC family toxin n=1 Tax=Immundisolibacter sp. TaxID=1934948 RepID=UPI003567F328
MIVLDTNVLSELLRIAADPAVLRWVAAQAPGHLYTTALTRAEMLYGARLLPPGKRQQQLQASVVAMFDEDFANRVLPFDTVAADAYARIAADRRQAGRPMSQFDAQIAAIVLANRGELATRNVDDFEGCGVSVVNPWQT